VPHRKPAGQIITPPLTFDGGNNYLDQSQVRPNQLVAGRNWWRDLDGVVRPRPGNKVWNAAALNADFQGLWEYRRQSDQVNRLMAYAGGTLFKGDDATKSFTLLVASLDTGARGFAVTAQDKFWFCNGKQTPRVFDGTNTYRIGIIPPGSAPTVALVAGSGNLPAEDHYYRYTYVREEGGVKVRESNPSPESTKVTNNASNAQNDVTVTASPDGQVTHIYIYRRSSSSVPEYKFVAKVSNTTQTYRDNIAVGSLGGFAFWEPSGGEEDHGYPPDDIIALTLHRDGRMYAWGSKSRLYYTRVLQYHYYPGAGSVGARLGFQIIVNEDDGDEGMAVLSEGDDLWLLKRHHVYRLLGDGPSKDDGLPGNWKIEQVPTIYGCAARSSAATGPAGAFWLSDDGPVRVDTRSGLPRLVGLELRPWLDTATDITKAVGWVWKFYYWLWIPVAGGKWQGHVYDARNGSWWRVEDMDAQAFATRENGDLVWGGILQADKPANGVVYEFNKQVTDNGSAVTAELTTRVIDGQPGTWKLCRNAKITCEANPGAVLTARMIPDQSSSYVERELKLSSGLTGARIIKNFTGTKRLQGHGFQLYLKSANTGKRPAIYGWQQEIHTFNREGFFVTFAEVFPDPDPTVGIVDGTFAAGTHTNTQLVGGKIFLAEETAWALAYSGSRANAKEAYIAQNKLIVLAGGGPKGGSSDGVLRLYVFDGGTWSEVVASGANYHFWRVLDDYQARHLVVLGNAVFVVPGQATPASPVRRSTDLVSFTNYGTNLPNSPGGQYCLGVYGGVLWVIDVWETQSAKYDGGAGGWVSDGDPGGAFPREYTDFAEYGGNLYTCNFGAGTDQKFKKWNGSAWSEYAVPTGTLGPTGVLRYSSITDKLYLASRKILEWNGTAFTERIDFGGTPVCRELVEVTEPTGRRALYACVNDVIYRSYDGITWANMGTFAAGKTGHGFAVYKGRRYVVAFDGDVYSNTFFKTSGTYRTDEKDLGAVKTSAQVKLTATIPSGTTLQSRIGYATVSGGPYTFTAWEPRTSYTVPINGRFIVIELQLTGDGTASPEVDEVELIAK
jgi:hypothetical protein